MPVTDQGLNNDIIIDQNNHDLGVRVHENDFDANSVHENLDDTVLDNDDQRSEVEQNVQVDDADGPFENQGAAHEHDEPNVIKGVVHHNNDQDDEQVTESNTVDSDTHIIESQQQQSNSITKYRR